MFKLNLLFEDLFSISTVIPGTLFISLVILLSGIIVGGILAVIRLFKVPVFEKLVRVFVSYVRGIPLIIHLYIAYYTLPKLLNDLPNGLENSSDITISPVWTIVISYSLYTSAKQSENIRAALLSVEPGQYEAAYSIGLTRFQTMMRIVFPQALKVAIPAFFNTYLGIIKGMSLGFTIGLVDILAQAKLSSAVNFGYLESYTAAGILYWALCCVLTLLFSKLEARQFKGVLTKNKKWERKLWIKSIELKQR